jgi:hypothetical protein
MAFGKLLISGWSCPDCGADAYSKTYETCDNCVLKFFFDNENASSFMDYEYKGDK